MKYAPEVIDLLSAHPGRPWKMSHVVRHVAQTNGPVQLKHEAVRKGVYRVLCSLQEGGQIQVRPAARRGAASSFCWKPEPDQAG